MTAKLIYFATRSLDGYIEDAQGAIDWTSPDEEGHRFVNDVLRPVGTCLYGRRMYEAMQVWTTFGSSESDPAWARDFAGMWRPTEKVVYSRTLEQGRPRRRDPPLRRAHHPRRRQAVAPGRPAAAARARR
jgi:dihydrofolate reductase